MRAQRIASLLMVELSGRPRARHDRRCGRPPSPTYLGARERGSSGLLGIGSTGESPRRTSTRLGFDIEADGDDPLGVTVPPSDTTT